MPKDASTELLIECAAVVPGNQVVLLGAGDGTLTLELARRVVPGGRVYLADYDAPALEKTADLLRRNGMANVSLISPDQIAEFVPASLDAALLQIVSFASSALVRRLLTLTGQALQPGALLYAAGPRNKGIEAVGRELERLFGQASTLRYGGGARVLVAVRPEQWHHTHNTTGGELAELTIRGHSLQLELRDGVFARGGPDAGSLMLCEALEISPDAQVLDLGCGGGLVGLLAARLAPAGRVTMVDSNTAAAELARANVSRNNISNAEVLVGDGIAPVADRRFGVIATNPPFHQGRAQSTDTALGFIAAAPAVLLPGGRFYLVCNRFLPYERALVASFGNAQEVTGDGRYRVLRAVLA